MSVKDGLCDVFVLFYFILVTLKRPCFVSIVYEIQL